jgi:hypothetical protein
MQTDAANHSIADLQLQRAEEAKKKMSPRLNEQMDI